MTKMKFEIRVFEYESFEDYLVHAATMNELGWKFQNQSNSHKEVTWTRDGDYKEKQDENLCNVYT
ncbi:hypothetical protein [Paenibacillus donghaensis]|uniref:Uncharacterized protein n=1 Tax=Paenibacillus donghaensis TaxID=414771 RepID=A0A2Z2K7X6_9BACL|nr:hypothetical protein [Paenibacillus donghaensis]ASA22656.1 hypothetical protein B9T62_18790 [Paenibacillus donghaensis]